MTDDGEEQSASKVGVVVIGRNERPRLELCLASIPKGLPVVYADSGSSDGSAEYAQSLGIEVVSLSPDRQMTAARGRNAGANRLLKSAPEVDYLQFIDGDCEIEPGWIEEASRFLSEHENVAVVCGRRREIRPNSSIYNKLCHQEWNTPIGEADASGGDSLVRASAFAAIGGFRDEQLAHEEPEMCARLRAKGWETWRIDHPMTKHDAAIFRFSQFYRRAKRGGTGMCQVVIRSSSPKDPAALAILRRAAFWGLGLPIVILALTFIDWRAATLLAAIYLLQWIRQAYRAKSEGFSPIESAKVGALAILSKFAELHGAVAFLFRRANGRNHTDLSY